MVEVKWPMLAAIFSVACWDGFAAGESNGASCDVYIATDHAKSTTEQEYLSFTLDPFLLHDVSPRWATLNFTNPRVLTLARGLSPAILRYGGTDADWQTFAKTNTMATNARPSMSSSTHDEPEVTILPKDVDNLRNLAVQAGGKLLFDLNIQLRYGKMWDPDNAIQLMKYIVERDYGDDIDFELGNEPEYPELDIDGTRIGEDFNMLRRLIDAFPEFRNSRLVGPDIGVYGTSGPWTTILKDFARTVYCNLTAVTIHHYYFGGPGAAVSEYTDVTHFNSLAATLQAVRDAVTAGGKPDMALWVGETSDSYNKGTPNVSDRYANGFLWLDKLGIAASHGYRLVARQIFYGGNYPLLSPSLEPNPDYWLSFVFKRLVGVQVLDTKVFSSMGVVGYARVYAHCTSPGAKYPKGSVTLYAINLLHNSSLTMFLDSSFGNQDVDVYLLSPDGAEGLLSQFVALNGKRLRLVNDYTLPDLVPIAHRSGQGITLPPLTFGFFVLPEVNAKACS